MGTPFCTAAWGSLVEGIYAGDGWLQVQVQDGDPKVGEKWQVKSGQNIVSITTVDDHYVEVKYNDTGELHRLDRDKWHQLFRVVDKATELQVGDGLEALPGRQRICDGEEYFKEYDTGTISDLYTDDKGTECIAITWDRTRKTSTFPKATWPEMFKLISKDIVVRNWLRFVLRLRGTSCRRLQRDMQQRQPLEAVLAAGDISSVIPPPGNHTTEAGVAAIGLQNITSSVSPSASDRFGDLPCVTCTESRPKRRKSPEGDRPAEGDWLGWGAQILLEIPGYCAAESPRRRHKHAEAEQRLDFSVEAPIRTAGLEARTVVYSV